MSPVDWIKSQHLLPPTLQCVRCSKRLRLSQKLILDSRVGGYVHDTCLFGYERSQLDGTVPSASR